MKRATAAVLAALALPTGASAAQEPRFLGVREPERTLFAAWVKQAQVPMPASAIVVHRGTCIKDLVAACVLTGNRPAQLTFPRAEASEVYRRAFYHEMMHVRDDALRATFRYRARFLEILGLHLRGEWEQGCVRYGTDSCAYPTELFAEAGAWCAVDRLHRQPVDTVYGYGYAPSYRQHVVICRLLSHRLI